MNIPNMLAVPIVLILVLVCLLFYPSLENSFVFYPDSELDENPSQWDLFCKDVYLPTPDGNTLHAWFFPVSDQSPVILFCHGNAGNISHRIENVKFLVARGMSVFLFDYRGYGKSSGRPSEKGVYLDGLAAYDYLTQVERISRGRIAAFGRSLGGAVAVEIALQRSIRCLIIESAFTSIKDMSRTIFPIFLVSPFIPNHYDNIRKIGLVSVPKLIIHGKRDRIVPFYMGEKLYAQAKQPKAFFPLEEADHNDTYVSGGESYFDTIRRFVLASNGS